MKNAVVWDMTPCDSCKNRRFGRTYRLHPCCKPRGPFQPNDGCDMLLRDVSSNKNRTEPSRLRRRHSPRFSFGSPSVCYGAMYEPVRISDYAATDGSGTTMWQIENWGEAAAVYHIFWRGWRKPWKPLVIIPGTLAGIRTQHLQNTHQEVYRCLIISSVHF
jgi:hypothetical protein